MMEKVNRGIGSAIDNASNMQDGKVKTNLQKIRAFFSLYPMHIFLTLVTYSVIVVTVAIIIPKFVVEKTQVNGTSMEDTLYDGDDILINKIAYNFSKPKRYDLVVFFPHGNTEGNYLVKRVIGLPGETIQIVNGIIYIDGSELEEDYGSNAIVGSGIAVVPITLADDEYFVLGDNRIISRDSGYKSVGLVKEDNIVGKVWLRIWPFDEFGTVE